MKRIVYTPKFSIFASKLHNSPQFPTINAKEFFIKVFNSMFIVYFAEYKFFARWWGKIKKEPPKMTVL
jgi:hypothetical protein